MMTDPVADMLTRIRNANAVSKASLSMPASKLKVGIAQVLKEEGYIRGYEVVPAKPRSVLEIELKYGLDGEHVIREIARISKPGRRIYSRSKDIPTALRGLGIHILSTPKGVVSDRTARRESLGGEILCRVS